MAIGRISGSVLKSNLTRNGTDLAFETNLLYLDVTNSRVGIGTSEPSSALHVNGTITTSSITTAGGTTTGNFTFNDSVELRLGTDADANIKHTGSDLNINETTGDIHIRTYANDKDVKITSDDGSGGTATYFLADGSTGEVKLYHYGTEVFNTSSTGAEITNTSTGDALLITTTEDSSSAGPVISLKRNSSSPSDADYLGQIKFKGENDADQEVVYAKITGKILDASDGTEDGIIEFAHKKAGSNVITGRFRSDSLQLLNGTNLSVDGSLTADGLSYPTSDGSAGQVLTTDGSGTLSFATISVGDFTFNGSTMSAPSNADMTFDNSGTGRYIFEGTTSLAVPNGTTAQRPTGSTGEIRYNSSTDAIEGYTTSGGWAQLGATSSTSENTDDTATGSSTAISTTEKIINQFTISSFDSAWYLTVTRDEINDQVSTAKHSLAHNDSAAVVSTSHVTRSDATNSFITIDADVTGGNARLKATGSSVVNSVSFYRIALGDNTSAGTTGNVTNVLNADLDSASESIDSWAHASYRAAKYYISVNNASKTEVSNIEALVVHDGTTAYITSYGATNTGSNDLINLTAAVDGSNVVVSATGNEPNLRVTSYRILLADDESGSTGDNVNVVAATTVSSTATTVDSFVNSAYTGAFYVFTGYNATEGAASATEVMVVSNDDAYISTGPTISSKGTDQLTFSATQSGSTVTVKAASTSGASTTVNGYRVHMLRGSAGASTADTVLVSTTQTITGAKTFDSALAMTVGSDPSSVTNKAHIYAKDESSSAEVFVRDEAGNVTKISPHNEEGEWEYYSRNTKTGKTVRINMEEMIRDIEKLTGKSYIKNN
jgi:hypothetical protein